MVLNHVEGMFELREPLVSYNPVFDTQICILSLENRVKWDVNQ
jgi:hypothetical protein